MAHQPEYKIEVCATLMDVAVGAMRASDRSAADARRCTERREEALAEKHWDAAGRHLSRAQAFFHEAIGRVESE